MRDQAKLLRKELTQAQSTHQSVQDKINKLIEEQQPLYGQIKKLDEILKNISQIHADIGKYFKKTSETYLVFSSYFREDGWSRFLFSVALSIYPPHVYLFCVFSAIY